jgi:hypothetical protein
LIRPKRQNFPFWTHQQLVLQPEYRPSEAKSAGDTGDSDDCGDGDNDNDEEDVDLAGYSKMMMMISKTLKVLLQICSS